MTLPFAKMRLSEIVNSILVSEQEETIASLTDDMANMKQSTLVLKDQLDSEI